MKLITDSKLKKVVELDYRFYSVIIRLLCPFCLYRATHKTKCYHSLKRLGHHIATEHKDDGIYPFSAGDIRQIMKYYALGMQLGMIERGEIIQSKQVPVFSRVKRVIDDYS